MNSVTLDELIENVRSTEQITAEPQETFQMLTGTAIAVLQAAESSKKIEILTDYDADGITSAYIMEKMIKNINPECDVAVKCSDRRGEYGLSPDIQGGNDTQYIVCDMGSNQLDLINERLGQDTIIIDHHLIDDESVRLAFANFENHNLCNPHALHQDDSINSQYCTAGLAYRIYERVKEISELYDKGFKFPEKLDNTLAIMACIGTATDMVDVMDTNSLNRQILKDGLQRIDNATQDNLEFVIGNMLARNKVGEHVTAYQLAFNVGSFINSASRMSEIINENGAMRMYNAITADPEKASTYRELDRLQELNDERKSFVNEITKNESYSEFLDAQRFGDKADSNIAVYQLPDDTPTAFAGLVANKLAEATDKAIICLTYHSDTETYSGSGRNAESNKTSLKEFLDDVLSLPESKDISIKYGGHSDAVGISRLDNIEKFVALIDENNSEMRARPLDEKTVLSISIAELNAPETLEKLKALEPVGMGLKIPPVVISGEEQQRGRLFKSGNENWKTVRVKDSVSKGSVDIADWSYKDTAYPQSGKKNNEVSLLARVGISDYRGEHTELTAVFDRAYLKERLKEIELTKTDKEKPKSVRD